MMQTYIRRFLNLTIRGDRVVAVSAPVALGRWSIQYDQKVIDRKIVQANEDHCGCCVVPKKNATATVATKDSEDYLLPYVV